MNQARDNKAQHKKGDKRKLENQEGQARIKRDKHAHNAKPGGKPKGGHDHGMFCFQYLYSNVLSFDSWLHGATTFAGKEKKEVPHTRKERRELRKERRASKPHADVITAANSFFKVLYFNSGAVPALISFCWCASTGRIEIFGERREEEED
jgi:hypothetical protein